ncbi:hypothetical protein HN51_055436 [Arachis hypogaea]|uniref:protein SIEVE ELEMENT OCCLUSION B n=1 Tax=Arachis ipaensis TaxID=130454 RepID=UPI0007AF0E1C|nr:protein SIEVE ELEMENT OCCLUSION B [Arachis ipaensis]XP_025677576.1 protein SIEVE ELEMENT OCCLUSION B [Arachis hypogaea]
MSNTIGSPQFPGIMKPGESRPGVPLISTSTPHPAIIPDLPADCAPPICPLNPFNVPNDNLISCNISPIHGAPAISYDVDSLFNVLSGIVISTSTISLDLQQVTLDLGQNKVPQVALQPAYSLLSEIACKMTCHSFDESNAHKSVVGVLEKLRSYAWDAKAVIALSAFALNYVKPLRLTVAQEASQKQNALELHLFTLAKEGILPAQSVSNVTSNLVKITLQLIKGIITLEKLFANRSSYSLKHFPTLCNDPRALYAYWAIFSLFACANLTGSEQIEYSWVLQKLNDILAQLKSYLQEIRIQQGKLQDLIWRIEVLQNPSSVGIWQLLKALIYPKNVDNPGNTIAKNATNELLTLDELIATENLFLFISGLEIDHEITSLTSIHGYKKGKIVWVPIVKDWTLEIRERFKNLKSTMPSWYVVEYYLPIEGYEALQQVWNYRGKPIVVVLDACANILNQNALDAITLWGTQAFPFNPATISTVVSQPWNWFWSAAFKIFPPIQTWVTSQEKYVFFYGGTSEWTEKFRVHLDGIEKRLEGTNTNIVQCNLTTIEQNLQADFWHSIKYSLLSITQNVETINMNLGNIQMLLSMKTLDFGWAIVTNGQNVILTGYNEVMVNVLEGFEFWWQPNISGFGGFSTAICNYYYVQLAKQALRPCMKLRLDNIPSSGLIQYTCPEPTCHRKMHIETVTFKCCHGNIGTEDVDNAFSFENGKGPAMIPPSAFKPLGPVIEYL